MRRTDETLRTKLHIRARSLLVLGLVAPLWLACETPLERAYGLSQRQHVARTIENPDAGIDDLEARRLDGRSTDAALGKHREAERRVREEEPSVINIDIGG